MKKVMKSTMKKSMKKSGKKAMKKTGMKKKAKRVSVIAKGKRAKASVFRGTKEKTATGLKKSDLMVSKSGKVVTKKQNKRGKEVYVKNGLAKFTKAVMAARKPLGIKGFVPIGGKTAKGQALLKKARSLYKK